MVTSRLTAPFNTGLAEGKEAGMRKRQHNTTARPTRAYGAGVVAMFFAAGFFILIADILRSLEVEQRSELGRLWWLGFCVIYWGHAIAVAFVRPSPVLRWLGSRPRWVICVLAVAYVAPLFALGYHLFNCL